MWGQKTKSHHVDFMESSSQQAMAYHFPQISYPESTNKKARFRSGPFVIQEACLLSFCS
jgi:hypothetical protein